MIGFRAAVTPREERRNSIVSIDVLLRRRRGWCCAGSLSGRDVLSSRRCQIPIRASGVGSASSDNFLSQNQSGDPELNPQPFNFFCRQTKSSNITLGQTKQISTHLQLLTHTTLNSRHQHPTRATPITTTTTKNVTNLLPPPPLQALRPHLPLPRPHPPNRLPRRRLHLPLPPPQRDPPTHRPHRPLRRSLQPNNPAPSARRSRVTRGVASAYT